METAEHARFAHVDPFEAEEALKARYRSAPPALEGPWNEVIATLLDHRSV